MTTRNEILAALRTRLDEQIEITTWFDRPKAIDQIGIEQHPAAFVIEEGESAAHQSGGSVWTLSASLWLVLRDTSSTGPAPVIRSMLEDVEDALAKQPGESAQHKRTTLGGLVYDVRIVRVGGDLSGVLDQCVAIVDLEIIVPVA